MDTFNGGITWWIPRSWTEFPLPIWIILDEEIPSNPMPARVFNRAFNKTAADCNGVIVCICLELKPWLKLLMPSIEHINQKASLLPRLGNMLDSRHCMNPLQILPILLQDFINMVNLVSKPRNHDWRTNNKKSWICMPEDGLPCFLEWAFQNSWSQEFSWA